ncbi:hypothetical protein LX36DRAFT_369934 [Colletotrichum falcatum]|nr:hypothetical protein LX36DRAFT_369934 [Colletotrichum falcatum]
MFSCHTVGLWGEGAMQGLRPGFDARGWKDRAGCTMRCARNCKQTGCGRDGGRGRGTFSSLAGTEPAAWLSGRICGGFKELLHASVGGPRGGGWFPSPRKRRDHQDNHCHCFLPCVLFFRDRSSGFSPQPAVVVRLPETSLGREACVCVCV